MNMRLDIVGMKKKAKPETMRIRIEKKEKILLIKLRTASKPKASFSIINGIKTEIDTIEATVTKIKSGMRKAA